jgi:hypothetical protein
MNTPIRFLLCTICITVFYFLFASPVVSAQVAEPHMLAVETIGGNGRDRILPYVTKAPDNGFIIHLSSASTTGPIASTFCNQPATRTIFIKCDADASAPQWSKCTTNRWDDTAYYFLFQTIGNEFVFCGTANNGNYWVIRKEDVSGNQLWIKGYGGSSSQILQSMIATDDGGYVFFGSSYSDDGDIGFHYGGAFGRDMWLLKVDSNGNKMWSKVYGGSSDDVAASVLPAPNGGLYIIGSTVSTDYDCIDNHGSSDVFVSRLNDTGGIVWRKCIGGTKGDGGGVHGCHATSDGNGGLLIATETNSNNGNVSHKLTEYGYNIWAVNLDSTGNIVWDNCYGGGGTESPNNICRATDGSIWIIGNSYRAGGQVNDSFGGGSDVYVVHADNIGNFLSSKVLGSSGQDDGFLMYPLRDGLVLAAGYYANADRTFPTTYGGGADAFLIKFTNWANDIVEVLPEGAVSVYPNPAKDIVRVAGADNIQYNIAISDITGRLVYSSGILGNTQISVAHWQAGMYYVHTIGANGHNTTHKLVIQ